MKVLVIGAHPDDEILGVGGTICKHVEMGDAVFVCIITAPYEPQWSSEYIQQKVEMQKKVDKFLKIQKRFNLDYPAVKLNTIPHGELNKRITDLVAEVDPDIVYTHFENDLNHDHTLAFRGAMVAVRPPKKIKLLCYETLSETEWSDRPFKPNVWTDISKYMDMKIEAMKIYSIELKDHPHPRSIEGIRTLAKKRGSEVCLEYAEGFRLIREIIL